MDFPFEYDHAEAARLRRRPSRSAARSTTSSVVILPVPGRSHDVLRRRHAQRPARNPAGVVAHGAVGRGDAAPTSTASGSSRCRRWSCPSARWSRSSTRSSASPTRSSARDKFLVTLGGEHSITPPLVSAAARKYPGLSVLQIDAHADMRDSYMGTRAQPRLRDAPRRCSYARADAGRHPQPLDRGSRGPAEAEHARCSTTCRCARTRSGSTRSSSRSADDVYVTHRRGRDGPGDHARHRHARARRPVVAGDHARCCAPSPNAAASSPPTSSN